MTEITVIEDSWNTVWEFQSQNALVSSALLETSSTHQFWLLRANLSGDLPFVFVTFCLSFQIVRSLLSVCSSSHSVFPHAASRALHSFLGLSQAFANVALLGKTTEQHRRNMSPFIKVRSLNQKEMFLHCSLHYLQSIFSFSFFSIVSPALLT